MAAQEIWLADDYSNQDSLRFDDSWLEPLDNAYRCEPFPWNGTAASNLDFGPGSWPEAGYHHTQRTDSVSTTISSPGIPSPEFAHPSTVDSYAHQGCVMSRRPTPYTTLGKMKSEQAATPSVMSDRESRQDDESQRLTCSECGLEFENLQGLDKHTKSSLHKAWRCHEAGCGKTYARRDTFLRHRIKHTNSVHTCHVCYHENKHKMFKRKDHLKEHMRNCHSRSVDSPRTQSELHSFHSLVEHLTADSMSECGIPATSGEGEGSSPQQQQQQAMKDLVRSLGTVLGDRHPNLIGKLEDKMTALSSSDMESVAENMAGAALAAKTYLTATKACSCPHAPT